MFRSELWISLTAPGSVNWPSINNREDLAVIVFIFDCQLSCSTTITLSTFVGEIEVGDGVKGIIAQRDLTLNNACPPQLTVSPYASTSLLDEKGFIFCEARASELAVEGHRTTMLSQGRIFLDKT